MPGGRLLLTLLAVAAFVLVVVYLRKTPIEATRLHIALGLVGGGAIGNLIDRMLYGQGDRLHRLEGREHEWPAFNIADAALCIGVGLMVLDMFMSRAARRRPHRPEPQGDRIGGDAVVPGPVHVSGSAGARSGSTATAC